MFDRFVASYGSDTLMTGLMSAQAVRPWVRHGATGRRGLQRCKRVVSRPRGGRPRPPGDRPGLVAGGAPSRGGGTRTRRRPPAGAGWRVPRDARDGKGRAGRDTVRPRAGGAGPAHGGHTATQSRASPLEPSLNASSSNPAHLPYPLTLLHARLAHAFARGDATLSASMLGGK